MFANAVSRGLGSVHICCSPSREFGLNDHERLVSKAELAEIIGMSTTWIDRQVRTNHLPWRPVGRKRKRFYVPDVLEWLDDTFGRGPGSWPGASPEMPSRGPSPLTYSLRRSKG